MSQRQLGTLAIVPVLERLELLAPPVAAVLGTIGRAEEIGVAEIDPALSDTAAFCEKYAVPMEQAANCIVLEAKRAERTWYAACVVLGTTRADINSVARKVLDARRVSFAPMEKAVELTGMEYGAITPIGLPAGWIIVVDKAVAEAAALIIGSGLRRSKLAVSGAFLSSLPNATVIEHLAQPRS